MRYYIIAGEASGDLHGSNLIKELKKLDASSDFRCWGGDLMQQQGSTIVKHYKGLAFMGFSEVLMNIRTIMANFKLCKEDLTEYKPDVLILIDYPGFNLRMAEYAKSKGIKVFYYISPQVWAWKQNRINKIKKVVDRMFVILPFEKDFYKRFDVDVDFLGHPLLDAVSQKNIEEQIIDTPLPLIALLPGSRKQEILRMLPVMLAVADRFSDYSFVIAAAPSIPEDYYRKFIGNRQIKLVFGKTYQILSSSYAAMVTSGTATLETALFGVPQVVCYKAGSLSYYIARMVANVKFISLVNLILEKEAVTELIQDNMNVSALEGQLKILLNDADRREQMARDYEKLKELLGGAGASQKIASKMYSLLLQKTKD